MNSELQKFQDLKNVKVVAEISGNHGGKISKALKLIEAAKLAGADAVKFQTYTPETISLNSTSGDFSLPNKSPWKKYGNYFDLYADAHTPWNWLPEMFEYARNLELIPFSSPFDESAVDFLENLNPVAYKIASPEINHYPMIEKISTLDKPIIFSLGVSSKEMLMRAVDCFRRKSEAPIWILQCQTSYPADIESANLSLISELKLLGEFIPGYSDHTMGVQAAMIAVALGAKMIEKHITLDREDIDGFFSASPDEFATMVEGVRFAEKALGRSEFRDSNEPKNIISRRSIYPITDISEGEVFSSDNIRIIRPGLSLSPEYYYEIIGKSSKRNIEQGERIFKEDF